MHVDHLVLTELSQSHIAINYRGHITYCISVPVVVIRVRQNSQNLDYYHFDSNSLHHWRVDHQYQ